MDLLEEFATCFTTYLAARKQQELNLTTLREQLATLESQIEGLTEDIRHKEVEVVGLAATLQAEFDREASRSSNDHQNVAQTILAQVKQVHQKNPEQIITLAETLRQQLQQEAVDQQLNGSHDKFLTHLSEKDHPDEISSVKDGELDQTIQAGTTEGHSIVIGLTKDNSEKSQQAVWPKTKPEAAEYLGITQNMLTRYINKIQQRLTPDCQKSGFSQFYKTDLDLLTQIRNWRNQNVCFSEIEQRLRWTTSQD